MTCEGAEVLGERQWIGIDVSSKAYDLIKHRLSGRGRQLKLEGKAWKFKGNIIQRTDIPTRTNIPTKPKYDYNQMRRNLYLEQFQKCTLCLTEFNHERHFELDHFYPKSLGGVDDISNRQLLCGSCNRIKGNKTMEEAIAIIRERDLICQASISSKTTS